MVKSKRSGLGKNQISVTDLLALLPQGLIDQLTDELSADKWVKKLKVGPLFHLVLYSILNSERLSLRVMESNFGDPFFQALAPMLEADEVTWTGIRERLIKVNCTFFHQLYEYVYQQIIEHYPASTLEGYHIKRYDSTMIATFSHLLEGMKVGNTGKGKTQVKLTMELTDDFLIKAYFHKEQAYLSEETALKAAIRNKALKKNEVAVFDKGIKGRKTFAELDSQGTQATRFVTRIFEASRFELLHPVWEDNDHFDTPALEFVQDSAVNLYESGYQLSTTKLRLIQYRVKKDAKPLLFLTNVWDVQPDVIAKIYQTRWDIEVLFRFLKQEMNLKHFVCNEQNAIQVMLYCKLIASMLVLIYKKINGIKSYKNAKIQFFKELLFSIVLETLDTAQGTEYLKNNLKRYMQRE